KSAAGRAHALWTLEGLQALDDGLLLSSLGDPEAGVREQALRLSERRLSASTPLRSAVAQLAGDPSPRVRFQLAFTLAEAEAPEFFAALAKTARQDAGDSWTATAVLSSARHCAAELLASLASDDGLTKSANPAVASLLGRLATLVGADG